MARIKYTPEALGDIQSIENYYCLNDNPKKADAIIDSIIKHIHDLKVFPLMGAISRDDWLASLGYHEYPFNDYTVYYIYDEYENIVHIIRILNQRQDKDTALKGMPYIDD